MPIHEYECQECGNRIEVIQRLKDRALKKLECDRCGTVRPVKKLVSAPAFQFKGDGWYVTDYADKKGKDAKSKGEEGSKNEGSKDKGGDAKNSESKKSSNQGGGKSSDGKASPKAEKKEGSTKAKKD